MKLKTASMRLLFAAILCSLTACTPTLECGSWVFNGTPTGNAFPLSSAFTFTPANCGKNCQCDQDIMTQITWVYDADSRTNIYATSADGARANADGWNIDRVDGAAYGYYGLQNNGALSSGYNTAGANGTPNTLFDRPGGWPANTYFYAVDAATCHSSRACNNSILGYYFWSYILDNNDVGQKFITATAWKDLDAEFQSALAGWNAWAPGSGSEDDGTATEAHAIAFPTLTDL